MSGKVIYWLGSDLRIADNPALSKACEIGLEILPVYIFDKKAQGKFVTKGASLWWLKKSLESLNKSFDGKINFYSGSTVEIIEKLIKKHKVQAVVFNKVYEPWRMELEQVLIDKLGLMGLESESFNASLLFDPDKQVKNDGTPYKVFTPFYKNLLASEEKPRIPLKSHRGLDCFYDEQSLSIQECFGETGDFEFLQELWTPGEHGASKAFGSFVEKGLKNYSKGRDYPSLKSTSKISPHLRFGEVSPNSLWHAVILEKSAGAHNVEHFLRELCWREFCHYQLYYFPELPTKNFNVRYDNFKWEYNKDFFKAWKNGQTGYPIVDAGMRELAQTGFMHNRVRMIVASFLIKNLLIDWREGQDWFWERLVDADLANNSANWQWVAGCGADAAPFFRIFNPVLQGQKFDDNCLYSKRFLPELKDLDPEYFFAPWEAPADVLKSAGVVLGKTYPKPIVDFPTTRKEALARLKAL